MPTIYGVSAEMSRQASCFTLVLVLAAFVAVPTFRADAQPNVTQVTGVKVKPLTFLDNDGIGEPHAAPELSFPLPIVSYDHATGFIEVDLGGHPGWLDENDVLTNFSDPNSQPCRIIAKRNQRADTNTGGSSGLGC